MVFEFSTQTAPIIIKWKYLNTRSLNLGCIIHYILILKFAVVKFEYTKYFFAVFMNLLNVKENELIILKIVFELIWIPWGRVCNAIETWGIRKCYFHK